MFRRRRTKPTARETAESTLYTEGLSWGTEQFRALRQEAIQSEAALQSSMQWGMASTIATLAGTIAISAGVNGKEVFTQAIQLLILGLVLPWFLFAMALIWMGEVRRLVKTGQYIRWMEDQVFIRFKDLSTRAGLQSPPPVYLSWEHYLTGGHNSLARPGVNWEVYVGKLAILCGGQLASISLWQIVENTGGVAELWAGELFPAVQIGVWAQLVLMIVGLAVVGRRRIVPLSKHECRVSG